MTDELATCFLRGQRAYLYEKKNLPIFLGMPEVFRSTEGGALRQTPKASIYWSYSKINSPWISANTSLPYGSIKLRVIDDGDCIYSTRCTVLRHDFSINILSSSNPLEGQLLFSGLGSAKIAASNADHIDWQVHEIPSQTSIDCIARKPFAGKMPIRVIWENGARCELMVPFPGKGGHFIDLSGSEINQRIISLDQLMRSNAVAVSHQTLISSSYKEHCEQATSITVSRVHHYLFVVRSLR